jgi:hypothetical protein
MKKLITLLLIFAGGILYAQDEMTGFDWPREIEKKDYLITLYQPQLETLEGNSLKGRMALSVKKGTEDPVFGASWFTVMLDTDKSSRTAVLESIDITKIKFPDVDDDEKMSKLEEVIEEDIESVEITMSLERIVAGLEDPAAKGGIQDNVSNEAPQIFFRSNPAVLVVIDGEPKLKKVDKSSLEYVVNTPFFIVKKGKDYYIKGENHWYKNQEIAQSGWKTTSKVPKDIEKLAAEKFSEETNKEEFSDTPPEIIVVTKPAELIVTNGEMEYEPIQGTQLLFITNTESDIILDINSQLLFVLINGRWYASKNPDDGNWAFVEPEKLPVDFVKIPAEGTSISSVRSSVPGTEEAEEAMYEQYIPQTAKVDRKTATTEVTYDGEPKFEAIDGTKMLYAVNTQSTVLKLDNTYYVVDDGIWFESKSAKGPWAVSDDRPEEVEDIPASSPVYNVKYVYIYDSTPDVVYVGYTPGYYHSYMYGGVVVYGTGYYYQPWYGYYYYPRHVTYGFGVHYNPYTGWGFSVGVSYGWLTVGYYPYSYWGPGGYAHGYRHGYYHGYHRGYHNGYRAGYARGRYDSGNLYRGRSSYRNGQYTRSNRNGVSTRNLDRSRIGNNDRGTIRNNDRARTPRSSENKRNNIYSDRNGNIYQRDNKGKWQEKRNRSTRPETKSQTPQNRSRINNPSTRSNLERQYQNRSRGNINNRNYNMNRSRSGSISRGGRRG